MSWRTSFFCFEQKDLSLEINFYQEQYQDKNDEPNQNLVISLVEYFVQIGVFSIGENHHDYKSNKKTDCKH